jgi:hypothetical protein
MAHEKTIVQSRDRQGADPLADGRGSVRISMFGTVAAGLAFEFLLQILGKLVSNVFCLGPHNPLAKSCQPANQADIC